MSASGREGPPGRASTVARVLAAGALAAGAALAFLALLGGDPGRQYTLLFETGGQLVAGNEVLVAGQPVGSIDSIDLTDDGQAAVEITVERPLTAGTTAQVRATSLSGIANRYIALQMGPESDEEIPEGSTLSADATTSPVDIDQLFDTFDGRTRRALRNVIAGQAGIYAGDPERSRAAYRYLAPGLQSTQRLLSELTADQRTFSEFLAGGSRVLGAIAERRDDLSELTENANAALSAIARESTSLDRALAALPPAMRQANTTFVNLRGALDDLDPLVATSKTATRDLAPFLRDLRPVARRSVPVVGDLANTVELPGPANDLTDALRGAPALARAGRAARERGIAAMDASQENLAVTRAYSPDLMGLISKLGQATAYYDADGHYARVLPVTNVFSYDQATDRLEPIFDQPEDQYDFYTSTPGAFSVSGFRRCPGAATQVAADGSNPFVEGPVAGSCDPLAIPFGVAP